MEPKPWLTVSARNARKSWKNWLPLLERRSEHLSLSLLQLICTMLCVCVRVCVTLFQGGAWGGTCKGGVQPCRFWYQSSRKAVHLWDTWSGPMSSCRTNKGCPPLAQQEELRLQPETNKCHSSYNNPCKNDLFNNSFITRVGCTQY